MTDLLVKNKSTFFATKEVTEGVFKAPTLSDEALEVLASGSELVMKRDTIERDVLTNTIEEVKSRVGAKTVSANIPMEFKAGKNEGEAPRGACLYESLLGSEIAQAEITTGVGNTATELKIDDADIAKLKRGYPVLIKRAGKFEVRAIKAIDTTVGAAKITLNCALTNGAPGDHVKIAAFTMYSHDDAFIPLSVINFAGGEVKEAGIGMKVVSGSLEGWETGKIPSFKFALSGLDMTQDIEAPTLPIDFSEDADAPVIFSALAFINGVSVDYNKIGLTLTNEKTDAPSAAKASGKLSQRKTKFKVEASIDPYKSSTDVDRFDSYNNNQEIDFLFFGFFADDTTPTGEFKNVVAVYIPQATITEVNETDKNGLIVEELKIKSFRKSGKDTVFVSFM